MISIATIWDRTTAVIAGRVGILLMLALLLLVLPALAQAALDAVGGDSFALRSARATVSLLVFVAVTMATISVTAVASDPRVDGAAALAVGRARLLPFLGISLVIGVAFMVATLPGILLAGLSGFSMAKAATAGVPDGVNIVLLGLALLYFLCLMPLGIWAAARLVPLSAVIVNERRGIGAIRRSVVLTRGMTLKLVGVLILYLIVFLVVLTAGTSVVGVVARLLAGADGTVLVSLLVAFVTAVITGAFSVVQAVFAAQLYVAAREAHDAA